MTDISSPPIALTSRHTTRRLSSIFLKRSTVLVSVVLAVLAWSALVVRHGQPLTHHNAKLLSRIAK